MKKRSLIGYVESTPGYKREKNEDNYAFSSQIKDRDAETGTASYENVCRRYWDGFGVFDGMGGTENGEVASRAAAEVLADAFQKIRELRSPDLEEKKKWVRLKETLDKRLRRGFQRANNEVIFQKAPFTHCGTTGTVLITDGFYGKVYHIGDSRLYLLRNGVFSQLTKDQTLAQLKIEAGLYEASHPRAQREKHQLTGYLGMDDTGQRLEPEESDWLTLMPEDRLMLCSDGVYDMVPAEELQRLLQGSVPEQAVREIISRALQAGGLDNVTCMVLEVVEEKLSLWKAIFGG